MYVRQSEKQRGLLQPQRTHNEAAEDVAAVVVGEGTRRGIGAQLPGSIKAIAIKAIAASFCRRCWPLAHVSLMSDMDAMQWKYIQLYVFSTYSFCDNATCANPCEGST